MNAYFSKNQTVLTSTEEIATGIETDGNKRSTD